MIRTVVMGAILGLIGGMVFSVLYFGAGQITTPMAYIHDVSGLGLGIMVSWIVALHRKASARK